MSSGRRNKRRTPRRLTERRKTHIKKFLKEVHRNPGLYGETGSAAWTAALIESLHEQHIRNAVTASDVAHWLETRSEFFREAMGAILESEELCESIPPCPQINASPSSGESTPSAIQIAQMAEAAESPEVTLYDDFIRIAGVFSESTLHGLIMFLQDQLFLPTPIESNGENNNEVGGAVTYTVESVSSRPRDDGSQLSWPSYWTATPQAMLSGVRMMMKSVDHLKKADGNGYNHVDWLACSHTLKVLEALLNKKAS